MCCTTQMANGTDSCNGTICRIRWKIDVLFNEARTSIFHLMRTLAPLYVQPFAICIVTTTYFETDVDLHVYCTWSACTTSREYFYYYYLKAKKFILRNLHDLYVNTVMALDHLCRPYIESSYYLIFQWRNKSTLLSQTATLSSSCYVVPCKVESWKLEGHYRCTMSMAIVPIWFSMEHLWIVI